MSLWIAGITRGHNAGVCLLKDGEIVFSSEEERFSRQKYDGGPYASMIKILDYTDKLDYIVVAHTQPLSTTAGRVDFTGDDVYTGLARKLGLIERSSDIDIYNHPQVIDLADQHHKLHAQAAFYRSGYEEAVAVIVDGAGTFLNMEWDGEQQIGFELESIFTCSYPDNFETVYKHIGGNGPVSHTRIQEKDPSNANQNYNNTYECVIDDTAGIVKSYEAVTEYCGWPSIEAGKTMGLSPYGNPNQNIPKIFTNGGSSGRWKTSDRNVIIPTYPNGACVNAERYQELLTPNGYNKDVTLLQNRRDLAYAIQKESQEFCLELILKAVKETGINNVVFSGGYGLNCVANYFYLDELNNQDINFYVEPISNDAGTALGAALFWHYKVTQDKQIRKPSESLYLGPKYNYALNEIEKCSKKYNSTDIKSVSKKDIVNLIRQQNIVAIFQGSAEAGPRALGNRSLLFDPTVENGKDIVNNVKRREYFRPFAASILKEHAHEWFDMKGMEESPFMMYAMNCRADVAEKIPSTIHVDGTCRIQTVSREQNKTYYELIEEFYKITEIPILFNTSFNLGGEPLVETLDDALRTLANSRIEYLYLPEHDLLITIRNEEC